MDHENEYQEAMEFYRQDQNEYDDCPCTCSNGCYNCLAISKGDFY